MEETVGEIPERIAKKNLLYMRSLYVGPAVSRQQPVIKGDFSASRCHGVSVRGTF